MWRLSDRSHGANPLKQHLACLFERCDIERIRKIFADELDASYSVVEP
jgi:hypothetical protein